MSDTDDTDLLLLIPPDFFLVRSDLEDFDSDSDIGFGHQEAKDTIVSDLISQVNDLESRICQIENLERTSTHCSTCHEDSLINQSIISLTESDVLRAQIKDQRDSLKKGLPDCPPMVKSLNNDRIPSSSFETENCIINLGDTTSLLRPESAEPNIRDNFKDKAIHIEGFGTLDGNFDIKNNKTTIQDTLHGPESQLSKEKQQHLLNEVDSFLLNKQLYSSEQSEFSEKSSCQKVARVEQEFINKSTLSSRFDHDVNDEDHVQSFNLTEVYKLINEMEETQNEMQKKLNVNISQLHSQDKNDDTVGARRLMKNIGQMYRSKTLDLQDLSTNSLKSLYNKQTEDVLDKFSYERGTGNIESLDTLRHGKDPETNYMLTQFTSTTEENPHQRTAKVKSSSPSRVSAGSYNPIDIVKANLPGRKDNKGTQSWEGKDTSNKSAGFRRQLYLEKPLSPLRASKSRTTLHTEQKIYTNQNENQSKNESDRLSIGTLHRTSRPVKTNQAHISLEEKFNTLTMQRESGTNIRENQNVPIPVHQNLINKPDGEILQQKISSNNLLSLSELWNKEPTFYSDDPNKLRQKLEEERYRRQHCEQQIQALQLRVLEEQEKLAVAIRVDQEKDRAIMQITESWKKLSDHWGELEEQRHSLAQQLQVERESSKTKSDELNKKVERWEKEVSQALDLAADYKEKSEAVQAQMESLKRDMDEKLKQADDQLHNMTEENNKLKEEIKQLTEQLKSLQQRLKEEEDLLSKLKAELEKSRQRLDEYEAENSVLKEQKASLTTGIKEERNRISILEQKLNSVQQSLNESRKKEKAAAEEVRMSQERIDVARTELRALYQGQLEVMLKEKLQEFQAQLEAVEAALKAEFHTKERQWAEKANEQHRQLNEKYKRDLLRMEEIHKANVNSWKEKFLESERLRLAVEKKLHEEADRRADIAQRLHSVMETQWREALNIISNPMKAVYEGPKDEKPSQWQQQQGQSPERLQGLRVSRSDSTTSLGPGEEVPFCQEGLVTSRTSQPTQGQQLNKYIQMLLERGPGNPVPDATLQDSLEQQAFPQPNNATANGNNDLFEKWMMENEKKAAGQPDRQNPLNKPPWR